MNIFYLDHDPVLAARLNYDSHIVKMPIELLQMLSTNIQIIDPYFKSEFLMKPAYNNHPCTIWMRSSSANFAWSITHTKALFNEYTKRYGKIHACQIRFEGLFTEFTNCWFMLKNSGLTKFTKPALAMPEDFKRECPISSYQLYYEYKQQMEAFKVGMYNLAVAFDIKEYSNGKKVRKIALKMVHNKK